MEFVTIPTFIFAIALVCASVVAVIFSILNIIQYKYIKELENALAEEIDRANHYHDEYEKLEVNKILYDSQEQ